MQSRPLMTYPLTILCTLAIIVLSLAPIGAPEMARDVPLFDKWAHFVMYGALTLTVCWELRRRYGTRVPSRRLVLLGVVFPVLLGGLMELGQAYLTTYRSGEWLDALADTIGALLGLALSLVVGKVAAGNRGKL